MLLAEEDSDLFLPIHPLINNPSNHKDSFICEKVIYYYAFMACRLLIYGNCVGGIIGCLIYHSVSVSTAVPKKIKFSNANFSLVTPRRLPPKSVERNWPIQRGNQSTRSCPEPPPEDSGEAPGSCASRQPAGIHTGTRVMKGSMHLTPTYKK